MSDVQPQAAGTNSPLYYAYAIRDREAKKAVWTRIGSAWPHADGQGLSIQLDALPIDGRITLRPPSEKK